MLKQIYIKNYALIDEVNIHFEKGFNVITGETGAGKSIIIGALSMILGERASSESIRSKTDHSTIEGWFDVKNNHQLKDYLDQHEIVCGNEIILRREITRKGHNRCFVNESLINNTMMKEIAEFLIDLHGQHQHQSLLRIETHIEFLDEFGELRSLVSKVEKNFNELSRLKTQLRDLKNKEQSLKERLDLYQFQLKEINGIDPQEDEEEELEQERRILENSETLVGTTSSLFNMLYDDSGSVIEKLDFTSHELDNLLNIDEKTFGEIKEQIESAKIIIDEISKTLQDYSSNIEHNPERLEDIRERLGQFSRLKKKYGGSMENVLRYREKLLKELQTIENFDEEIEALQKQIEEEKKNFSILCIELSEKRKAVAVKLEKAVVGTLIELGIKKAQFKTVFQHYERKDGLVEKDGKTYDAYNRGMDFIEYYISTNIGEEAKPLVKVASGGEISRIMLALKSILANADQIPTLIFDEVDIGISGRIARAVGQSLKRLSKMHQLICITHLPQIASLGDIHLTAYKTTRNNRTTSTLRKLNDEGRITELAKLLGADEVTEAGLKGAADMLKKAGKNN